MNKDLQVIKKKYGENMSRLCRDLFPPILETEGLLPSLLIEHFEPSHQLYNDINKHDLIGEFKNYIYSFIDVDESDIDTEKTPRELLNEAGYILYECNSKEDMQSFKKYYAKGEELCTFNGGRLDRCRVFFAVKKDIDRIKREDFTNPKRQDEYGTSVISIQFTKDWSNTLSIKNRYNHTVKNPDATFSNNLDNIIPGLTKAFEQEYGIVQKNKKSDTFEIPNYVQANDGRYYKYNYESANIYYCPNNIIIDHFEVKRFEKEKYIVLDYFILDLQNKKITLYDNGLRDSFPETIGEIEKIEVLNIVEGKEINITSKEGEVIRITLDQQNRMIKLINDNLKIIGDFFLSNNTILKEAELSNVEIIGDCFLESNKDLERLYAPYLRKIADNFLVKNVTLRELELESLEIVGRYFLAENKILTKLYAPNLREVGMFFLENNSKLITLNLESLEFAGSWFLCENEILKKLYAPNLRNVKNGFLRRNLALEELNLESLESAGAYFLQNNRSLTKVSAPNLINKGYIFLIASRNKKLEKTKI